MATDSFQVWLVGEIREVLGRTGRAALLLWCDPRREWPALLRAAAAAGGFELWAPAPGEPDEHELTLRDRFCCATRASRLVWLPCDRDDITWFKPFELEADAVWEAGLLEALRRYGAPIPRDQESRVAWDLPRIALEWFDLPKKTWDDLPDRGPKSVFGDDRLLEALAGSEGEFERIRQEDLFETFARRAAGAFGLPDPSGMDEQGWRLAATARLLATEAAEAAPQDPPGEADRIIPPGLARKAALDLLKTWQNHILYLGAFEALVRQADATLGLAFWARNLAAPPRSRSSHQVEKTLFDQATDRLDRLDDVERLAQELEQDLQVFKHRDGGFWERQATEKIGWRFLVQLADAASLLVENAGIEATWRTANDAVAWYVQKGWRLDEGGERLFKEEPAFPAALCRVRARLRRGYLRAIDRIARDFSSRLASSESALDALPTAGEVALAELQRQKAPTALVFLDACRLDLGQRLAGSLNRGEPVERAKVMAAAAPVPSTTPLGMAFALPMPRGRIAARVTEGGFEVRVAGFDGNLAVADDRRRWLAEHADVKECLTIDQVLDGESLKRGRRTRRVIAVFGGEFDRHDGELQLTGADDHLERCVQAIRKLRDAGYSRVIVVTDHGFFHWTPEEHEIEEKPSGEVLWLCRRAAVGRDLKHPHALRLAVRGADLEAMVPRGTGAFKTYGGLEFFHGGATLQELVIPVLVATWPAKARKVPVVLKPIGNIASRAPRVQVQAGALGQATLFADENLMARQAVVKVREPQSGRLVFKHPEPVTVEPEGEPVAIALELVQPPPELAYNAALLVELRDADDDELLATEHVTLKVEINDW